MVANAGMYAAGMAVALGARPVFVDIEPRSMTMCPEALGRALDSGVSAVLVTHLYGRLADMNAILATAQRADVPVVEDCAQAVGARRGSKAAGSFGRVGCFSFYPTKNLGALGDAGALITDDADLAARLRSLRQYGWSSKYRAELAGGRNSRMDALQAAVLRVKLPHVDAWNATRRAIVARFASACAGSGLVAPEASGEDDVAHLCVLRTERRERVRAVLEERGVRTDIHYPIPDHRQAALAGRFDITGELVHTERASAEILSVPLFPELTEAEIERICAALAAVSGE
jgi:dTDP-4-amino-4,6-dideoxygalactose transaminase